MRIYKYKIEKKKRKKNNINTNIVPSMTVLMPVSFA